MTTIVNTPTPANTQPESNSGINGMLAVVLVLGLFLLMIYLVLPVLRKATAMPQINVPDRIDVNVNTHQ